MLAMFTKWQVSLLAGQVGALVWPPCREVTAHLHPDAVPPFHLSLPLPPTSALEPLSLGIHTVKAERTLEPQGVLGRGLLPSAVLSGGYAGLGSLWGREGPSLQRDQDVGRERPGDSVVWGQGWQEWHWDHQGTVTPRRPSGGARERTPGACAITLHSCSPSVSPLGSQRPWSPWVQPQGVPSSEGSRTESVAGRWWAQCRRPEPSWAAGWEGAVFSDTLLLWVPNALLLLGSG